MLEIPASSMLKSSRAPGLLNHLTRRHVALWMMIALSPFRALGDVDFANEVRPILSATCFACHGPDAEHREADLRLDQPSRILDAEAGLVTPGDLDASELWLRVNSDDPELQMPPPDAEVQLTAEQREVIRTWIAEGADWEEHWAFVPPERPTGLKGTDQTNGWAKNAIDQLVYRRLKANGLEPSPATEKLTWLRRASLDLIGLPPTPAEAESFLQDPSEQAYERAVERLLASEHYGERWARIWLDAARYADSDGYEKDKPREVWFYRDWVIRSFNHDLPYDQFIVQQIAGDLLPSPTPSTQVATGFLRNSMINEEGGVDPEQFRMEAMFDRMDAVGKAVLGLTINCAQCHSHKYDPLSQEEYYSMFAFLNNSHEAQVTVYTDDERVRIQRIAERVASITRRLTSSDPDWKQDFSDWQRAQLEVRQSNWEIAAQLDFDDASIGGQKFRRLDDGSYLAGGYAPTKFRPKMSLQTKLTKVTAFRLELLTDPNLPRHGPGRSIFGTAALSEFDVEFVPDDDSGKTVNLKFARAEADSHPSHQPLGDTYDDRSNKPRVTGPIAYAVDDDESTAWTTSLSPGRSNQPQTALFVLEQPIEMANKGTFHVYLSQRHGGWNSDDNQTHNLGRFRISLTDDAKPTLPKTRPELREICETPAEERTAAEAARLLTYWCTIQPQWQEGAKQIEQLWNEHPLGTTQLVLQERKQRRDTSLLNRGDFLSPIKPVEPGVPAFLHPMDSRYQHEPLRLQFARWLVDPRSPTTARSIVNRIWQSYFGIGIVETSDDLGSQSTPPSDQDLLDLLAVDFMEHGWSLKWLHRQIVLSATYRQSSNVSRELYQRDPYNRLLARGARFRVHSELVRDIMLAASGLLNRDVGGRSVYPPAPEFLFQPPVSYGPKTWTVETGPNRYRRGLYTFRFRSVPYPMLEAFDGPPGNVACVRRSRSNTPLQSLTTLNEPLAMECAVGLASEVLSHAPDDDLKAINYAMLRCVTRRPTETEATILLGMLDKQRKRLAAGEIRADEIVAAGNRVASATASSKDDAKTSRELAAWTLLARVLLNLDETITKE